MKHPVSPIFATDLAALVHKFTSPESTQKLLSRLGVWHGLESGHLGLKGPVAPENLDKVLKGVGPDVAEHPGGPLRPHQALPATNGRGNPQGNTSNWKAIHLQMKSGSTFKADGDRLRVILDYTTKDVRRTFRFNSLRSLAIGRKAVEDVRDPLSGFGSISKARKPSVNRHDTRDLSIPHHFNSLQLNPNARISGSLEFQLHLIIANLNTVENPIDSNSIELPSALRTRKPLGNWRGIQRHL